MSPVQMPLKRNRIPPHTRAVALNDHELSKESKERTIAVRPEKDRIRYKKSLKKTGASAPGTVTIEASIAIPLFLFAVLCLVYLIELQSIRVSIVNAAQSAAKNAAEDTAIVPVLNTIKLKSDLVSFIGEERIERSILDGGSSAIKCWKSRVNPNTGEMKIIVEYKIKVPFFGNPTAELREEMKLHSWSGYEDGGMKQKKGEIVYITETGGVYHENYNCTYLRLSVEYIPSSKLERQRNKYGRKYRKCEKCVYGSSMLGVYITGTGTKYHNSLDCSGLKRTVYAVNKSEALGRRGCSRCSG